MDAVIEKREEQLDDLGANAAETFGEDVSPEQEHGAHFFSRQWIADAAGMAAY
jgi:hypothetical protein